MASELAPGDAERSGEVHEGEERSIGEAPIVEEPAPEEPAEPAELAEPLTWAQRAARSKAAQEQQASHPSSSSTAAAPPASGPSGFPAPSGPRRDTILDYLLLLARRKAAAVAAEGESAEPAPEEPEPEIFRRYAETLAAGVGNRTEAKYARLGMRNDANNCYANAVVQAILPCSALSWLLSRADGRDDSRPFHACLMTLFKEFHTRPVDASGAGDLYNVMAVQQVFDVLSRWQRLGAQQDAAEFLFHMLSGLHDECKWRVLEPPAPAPSDDEAGSAEGGSDWAHLVRHSKRRAETRSAGFQEDSPILRIFGGLIQSAVRSKSAKVDSVTLEPFNHLDLDISQAGVSSVRTALGAFCSPEAVKEGEAMRRLQLKVLPKVLILCLKRFTYSKGKAQKVKKAITFDQKLVFDKEWLAEGAESPEYFLTSVVCHIGEGIHGGHYNAIVRFNADWYLYNDSTVTKMEPRQVGAETVSAYLLVYQSRGMVDFRP